MRGRLNESAPPTKVERGVRLTLAQVQALVWAQPSFESKSPTRRTKRHAVYMLTAAEARELAQACAFWLAGYDVDSTTAWPTRRVLTRVEQIMRADIAL